MVVWLSFVAILAGLVAVGAAVLAGWPWYLAAALYPLAGSLGGLAGGAALWLCRARRDSPEPAMRMAHR